MNIRERTCIVVKRGPDYLVGRILGSRQLRWSIYPYDAWCTRKKEEAEFWARRTGGDLWLFNPVNGQLREMRRKDGRENDGAAKADQETGIYHYAEFAGGGMEGRAEGRGE